MKNKKTPPKPRRRCGLASETVKEIAESVAETIADEVAEGLTERITDAIVNGSGEGSADEVIKAVVDVAAMLGDGDDDDDDDDGCECGEKDVMEITIGENVTIDGIGDLYDTPSDPGELKKLAASYLDRQQLAVGDLVVWKPGLKQMPVFDYGSPAVVIDIAENRRAKGEQGFCDRDYEPRDVRVAVIGSDGGFDGFWVDGNRLTAFAD